MWVCGVAMFYSVQGAWPKCVCVPKRNGARCGFDLFFLQNSCSITKKKSEKIVPFPSTHSTPVSKKNEIIQVCVCVCVQEKKLFFFVFFTFFCRFSFFLEKNGEDTRSSHTGSRQMKKKTIEERDALRCHPPTHTIVKKNVTNLKKNYKKRQCPVAPSALVERGVANGGGGGAQFGCCFSFVRVVNETNKKNVKKRKKTRRRGRSLRRYLATESRSGERCIQCVV